MEPEPDGANHANRMEDAEDAGGLVGTRGLLTQSDSLRFQESNGPIYARQAGRAALAYGTKIGCSI